MNAAFRAVLWKEWRQLRPLRWFGWALGAVLPALFVAGAESARHGLWLIGHLEGYTRSQILTDAVPLAFVVGVWPLLALLFGAQSFAGDRAMGTESFLLERPIRRSLVWWARLAAAGCSLLGMMAGTLLIWGLWVLATGGPGGSGWLEPVRLMTLPGPAVAGVALICTVTAASFLGSPMVSVLMGVVLAAIPAMGAAFLSEAFPFARYRGVLIGMIVPWILLGGYMAASFAGLCRGEPAGRYRIVRGVLPAVLASVLALFIFAAVTPAAIRRGAAPRDELLTIEPSPGGEILLASSYEQWQGGRWLVDVASARRIAFFPPPNGYVRWNETGTTLALTTQAGPLGSRGRLRLSFFGRDGKPVAKSWILGDDDLYISQVQWSRERILLRADSWRPNEELIIVNPATGTSRSVAIDRSYQGWSLAGTASDGHVLLAMVQPGTTRFWDERGRAARVPYGLYRLDPETGILDPKPVLQEVGRPYGSQARLSPSGRYWLRDKPKGDDEEIIDLETGRSALPRERIDDDGATSPWRENASAGVEFMGWPDQPLQFWLETHGSENRLVIAKAREIPKVVRTWSGVNLAVDPSPDWQRLLVSVGQVVTAAGETRMGAQDDRQETTRGPGTSDPSLPNLGLSAREQWVYEISSDRWIELPHWDPTEKAAGERSTTPPSALPPSPYGRKWVGPHTLARVGRGLLGFEDIDSPGKVRYVFGP